MAGCGEGELAVVGSGEGERAVGASDEGEPVAAGTDEGLLHSLDYPCTARLRLRRLLAYLRGHGYAEVYKAARGIMPVIFHVRDLVKKVKEGQWQEAAFYVSRFAPIHESSYEANLLLIFLMDLMGLNAFADGRIGVATFLHPWFISIYKKPVLDKYPCFATVVADVLLKRKDHARAFLDWQLIRKKAAKVVEKMAYKTPELRDKMDYPRGRNDLYHVVPIGFKRQLKKVSRKQSTDLAQFYLQMKKSLPSSQGADHIHSDSPMLRGEPLMALLETSLGAGKRVVLLNTYLNKVSHSCGLSQLVDPAPIT